MVKIASVDRTCVSAQLYNGETVILCALGFATSSVIIYNVERTVASFIEFDDGFGYVALTRVLPDIEEAAR